ncbi:IMV membrane protein [Equine molluscum contagiosum-like virus]|nr:IMV membrane protein [Equine molluscum contagiosum-like virus]
MDHKQCLLTMFFADDSSFFTYLADQDDDAALEDVLLVKHYLDFLLALLVRAKDKLEALGHCYEPLSEDFRALVHVRAMRELRKVHDRALLRLDGAPVRVSQGYLADFVLSLVRLARELDLGVPPPTRYVDPRDDPYLASLLEILHGDGCAARGAAAGAGALAQTPVELPAAPAELPPPPAELPPPPPALESAPPAPRAAIPP